MDNEEITEWILGISILLISLLAGLAGILIGIRGFILHEPLYPPMAFMFSLFFLGLFWWGVIDLLFDIDLNGVDIA